MEDLPTLQAFLPNSGVGYPVARDVNQEMNQAYRIDSFPTLVVVSKSGRVIYSESPPDFDAVRRVLDRELANG